MKTLSFSFMHPVKGTANLVPLADNKNQKIHFAVDSRGSNLLEVPLNDCGEGQWEIVLEWEHDGQNYCHRKDFEIPKGVKAFAS